MTRFFFLLALVMLANTNAFSKSSFLSDDDPILITLDSFQHPNCYSALGYIAVTATGGNPGYTYLWNTGATSAILTGLSAGAYEVTATDQDGLTSTFSLTLTADFNLPTADAGAPTVVSCSNSMSTLNGSGSSGPDFSYQWIASNGGHLLSGANSLNPVEDEAGTFQLTVTNLNNGCSTTAQTTVTGSNPAPAATATGGVLNCYSNSVTLSVVYTKPNTRFSWQGPGGFMSQLESPVVTVAGNYIFTLTDTLTGCIRKATAVVTSNLTPPNVDASGGGTITCAQASVQLLGASTTPGATFTWTGPNGYSSNVQNPIVSAAGVYTLSVQNPVNGCTATDAVTVAIDVVAPIPTASVTGTLTCNSLSVVLNGASNTPGVSYSWTGPNNYLSTLQNPLTSAPGLYTLTIKNPINGCTGTTATTVQQNITPPNASASGGVKTCTVLSVTLMGSSTTPNVGYSWTGPNGFQSNLQNPMVSAVGTYTLKVTNFVNGCTATATANVSQNITAPIVSATSTTITCTNPLGQITTSASPQGLTYNWTGPSNFSSTLKNPQVAVAGYYYVTATNPANGCTNTSSVYTSANITPPFAYAGEDKSLNCYFKTILINGSFSSNGPNYTYQWTTWDGHIVMGANTLYPTVDSAGNYTLKVTNTQNGCIDLDSMVVIQSTPVTATITQTSPVHCSGGSNGTARVTAGGGSDSYSYTWSNGKTTDFINGLSAGVYTVTVMDSEGCSATASTTIQQLILNAVVNVNHQTIPGINNGSASVFGSGGTAPYTVLWSTGAVTLSIGGLAPGPYALTLTDANGCTIVRTLNVNAANCIMTGTGAGTNLSCSGANNGTATINLVSALNPVTYIWSNGGTTKTINNLAPGSYTVTATDASNCPVVQTVQISSPQPLIATVASKTDVRCPSAADGSITVGVTGGVQPYTYKWSNNASSASIFNLAPGIYTLTTTDANACTSTVSAQINSPSPITITVVAKTDVPCPGTNTGAITIMAQGGLPPYQYFWSNGSTLASISGLTPNNYTITVTDHNDCPKSLSAQIVIADQAPPVLNLKNATVDMDNSGTITVSASQFDNGSTDDCGIASWTVTPNTFNCSQIGSNTVVLTATDPGGNTSTGTAILQIVDNIIPVISCPTSVTRGECNATLQFNQPQVTDNCQVNPAQLIQLSGLSSGSVFPVGNTLQSYQYSDLSGNTVQCSFTVAIIAASHFNSTSVAASCSGACDGSISLSQISGGNVNILWSNGQNGLYLTNLCPGAYTASITDDYGCSQTIVESISVLDVQAPGIICPSNINSSYCAGPVVFNAPVVTDNCQFIPGNLQQVAGLASGALFPVGNTVQTFTYVDGGGNTGTCSFTVSVTGPPSISTSEQAVTCATLCNGTAAITVSGGNSPFSIHWSNGQSGLNASNLCAGDYSFTITDNSNCAQAGSVHITEPLPLLISAPQVVHDQGNTGVGSIQINVSGGVPAYTYQWTRNGQFFAATEDLSNLFMGQYIGIVTDANGCTQSSGLVVVTSLVETFTPEWTQFLNLSPNPATTTVLLDFNAPLGQTAAISLLDLNGRNIYSEQINGAADHISLDVSNCAAGLWFIQIRLADGQVTTRKLVVGR